MDARVLMTVEEYRHASFDGPDRDYVDGEVIQEYLAHGVEWVWVVDPDERRTLSYSPAVPGGTLVDVLRTQNPDLAIPLADLLSVLN
jgi:Uma2 family endonuclease